jgi:hypothetical protein
VNRRPKLLRRRIGIERGAVLVEFAIIAPLIMLLFTGILEFGLAWRNVSVTTNSVRAGARTAASVGNQRAADFEILHTLGAGLGDLEFAAVDRVVVYRSTTTDGKPPSICLTDSALTGGGVAGICNVYQGSDLATLDIDDFDGATCSSAPDVRWCPLGRDVSIDNATYVGVYIELHTTWVTGLFPGEGIDMTDFGVARLEPQA